MSRPIVEELETASLELDCLIGGIHAWAREARSLEQVEERAKAIANRILIAVRGPDAVLRRPSA